jgi:hypothetical protein
MERVWKCIWRLRSSNLKIHLEAENKLNSEMDLEVVIDRVWRLGNSEMHLEAEIKRLWRCIWRPRSCNSEMHLEAEIHLSAEMHLEVIIERVWRLWYSEMH